MIVLQNQTYIKYIHNENLILMLSKQPTVSNLSSPLLTPFLLFIGRHVPNHYDKMFSNNKEMLIIHDLIYYSLMVYTYCVCTKSETHLKSFLLN